MKLTNKIIKEAMAVGEDGLSFDNTDFDVIPMNEDLVNGFMEAGELLGIHNGWSSDYEQAVLQAKTTQDVRDFLVDHLDMPESDADELVKGVVDYFGTDSTM